MCNDIPEEKNQTAKVMTIIRCIFIRVFLYLKPAIRLHIFSLLTKRIKKFVSTK